MSIERKFAEIRKFCAAHADAALAQKYARYFTEGYDPYGLDSQLMETQRDAWLEAWRAELGLEGFLRLGDRLAQTGKYEEGSFAILFAAAFKKDFTAKTLARFGKWLATGFRNWAHVDVLSGEVLSHFFTEMAVPMQALAAWRSAKSKWQRRAVPVTLISALKAGYPIGGLLRFVSPMMRDQERVVQQGLGWFLREAWKKQPAPVEKFLRQWKDRCARVIVQYATERMTPGKKARFKKSAR